MARYTPLRIAVAKGQHEHGDRAPRLEPGRLGLPHVTPGVVVEDDKLVIAKTRAKRKDAWQKVSDAVKKSKLPKAALGRVAKAALVQLQAEIKAAKSK